MTKKKNTTLLLLLLLILAATGIYFFYFNATVSKKGFKEKGVTTINSNDPQIKIWDYSAVDGDTINFYFDGKLIYKDLAITDSAVVYSPGKLSKGEHWIGIQAISEGAAPPATPHISIGKENDTQEFDIESYIDSASSWNVIVK